MMDPDALEKWFPRTRKPADNTFEIGLVLGGTVSAGAYTAGVLDYLIELLDAYEAKKASGEASESHNVRLKIITGASGGGMCAAIFAAACRFRFPHIHADGDQAQWEKNPLYRTWVKDVTLADMLQLGDARGGVVSSMLNCVEIENIADRTVALDGLDPVERPWLVDPLRVSLSMTDLDGVPYEVTFRNEYKGHQLNLHADLIEFDVPTRVGQSVSESAPGVFPLASSASGSLVATEARSLLREAALGTGAFPIALKSRPLRNDIDAYRYRFATWAENEPKLHTAKPVLPGTSHPYWAVDGGTLNNEPYEHARRFLAGLNGRNPRGGEEANRAIILIDPLQSFGEAATLRKPRPNLWDTGLQTLNALMGQSKFKQTDLALMQDKEVFSRFLIGPSREGEWVADTAIASSGLGAFLGFVSEKYRHHDFMLGRRNAQWFFEAHFRLPAGNDTIDHTETGSSRIIPDYTGLPYKKELPQWPNRAKGNGPKDASKYEKALGLRLDYLSSIVRDLAVSKMVTKPWARALAKAGVELLWRVCLGGVARRKILSVINDEINVVNRRSSSNPHGK
ncbi:MAG: hypothetical protein AAF658_01475 [Myxococcota bacterium]